MNQAILFVVDDDEAARTLLAEALVKEGYEVEAFASGQAAVERGKQAPPDVVLTDIRMEEGDGFLVLKEFKRFSPETSIVLLTAFGSLEGAIEAIKQGAYDYLAKPFKREEIRLVVQRSLEHCRLVRENARFRDEARVREPWSHLVGSSPAMLEVYKLVARVSDGRSTVLLEGESGTGKELIAQAVHLNSVGAKAGLFEAANGGTLFLDEIGDLGQALQVKLLRVMQEQEVRRVGSTSSVKVDVRIIAATNRDLAARVKEGKFRDDLYYRLNVVRIALPSLAQRQEDIPMLAHHFLQKYAKQSSHVRGFAPETMVLLKRYQWPGNVRELENAVERAVSLSHGPLLLPEDLPESIRSEPGLSDKPAGAMSEGDPDALLTLDEVEKRHLSRVLKETRGNKVKAAKILGIDRRTLYRMAERFGLDFGDENDEK
ncbi:MAG: sigma-54-dependent Fis family transcriptional regulator [Nitrospira sp. NTP1]|nr:sigma-54-dependent Fis family transcriptional regulator [Nitrospira sp. NTP1]